MSCPSCKAFEGLWTQTPSGLRRCSCPTGRALAETDQARKFQRHEEPRITSGSATAGVQMLSGCLDYFPPLEPEFARIAIANEIRSMCASDDEVLWLVERMNKLFKAWPGTREMRAVYCSKFRPLDGFEVIGCSSSYPDGIPSEHPPQIEAPPMKALPGQVSAAESINQTVLALAEAKDMRNTRRSVPVPDIPILPAGKRISQADIDAAVNQNRKRIAREELGE